MTRDLLTRTIDRPSDAALPETMPRREWLVTNGLGGYAAGTVAGVLTRRHHGLLVASLPAPLGRVVMLNHLRERVRVRGQDAYWLGDDDEALPAATEDRHGRLVEFRLELGLPVWLYECGDVRIEKRIVMPHGQNTVHVTYRLAAGEGPVRLALRPSVHFRGYEDPVTASSEWPYAVVADGEAYEVRAPDRFPPLRVRLDAPHGSLVLDVRTTSGVPYPVEASRGYEAEGALWSFGY
ncbi:MAG TPA: glycogen debranching enzyme N-terminal domain-containing protein, partial [Gemmatimonadaceae bacterium]|nr:glycogen debranching enzyme N-terminal domain-containing protein [Gemmatimonadaceae bacterium]